MKGKIPLEQAETIAQNMMKKIIGLGLLLPPQKDLYQNPQKKDPRFVNSLSPLAVKTANPAGEEMFETVMKAKQAANKSKAQAEKMTGK